MVYLYIFPDPQKQSLHMLHSQDPQRSRGTWLLWKAWVLGRPLFSGQEIIQSETSSGGK